MRKEISVGSSKRFEAEEEHEEFFPCLSFFNFLFLFLFPTGNLSVFYTHTTRHFTYSCTRTQAPLLLPPVCQRGIWKAKESICVAVEFEAEKTGRGGQGKINSPTFSISSALPKPSIRLLCAMNSYM